MAEKKKSFEENMARLEEIVKLLEHGEVHIEKAMELFEEGTALMKTCGTILDKAEQKVRILTKAAETPETEPFEAQE